MKRETRKKISGLLLYALSFSAGGIVVGVGWTPRGAPDHVKPPLIELFQKETFTNGTAVILFPEWATSTSAFRRKVYKWYIAVHRDGHWYTKERQDDGSLVAFWKSDKAYETLEDARIPFGLSIQFNISKALYDSLVGDSEPLSDMQDD